MTSADSHSWLDERLGIYLLGEERALLAKTLPTIFGYFLVQAGLWGPAGALWESSPIRARFLLAPRCVAGAQILGHPAYLPFASDAVDALLLPHTLEQADDPHQVLREAERVLTGEGHIVLLGFHPWGLWSLREQFATAAPWAARYIGAGQLREWLAVLGFETVCVTNYLFCPPFRGRLLLRSAVLDRWRWRFTAGAYMLVARKRVFAVTPLRWKRARRKRAFADVVKPTVR